ncbi:hypothetical protein [Chitinophaga sp. CF418]|uniref:hypothetical protein n=1 Tax=Chitinophaga sp. CF418 TaxID=1855287 RepID=UPI000913BB2A|nr:hypothetical protein [Chitinophaga sp. CF418]SHN45428.1 hypothetical protein SAMN05216311_12047 [Chitinophaga sp. CF418]
MAIRLPCAMSCYLTQIIVGTEVTVVGVGDIFVPFVGAKENSVLLTAFAFAIPFILKFVLNG